MKVRILQICLAVFLLAAGYLLGSYSPKVVHAQGAPSIPWSDAPSIPKSYGKLVNGSGELLYFEDLTGTIRVVDLRNGVPGTFTRK